MWCGEVKARRLDTVLLGAHIAVYLTAVFLVLSPPPAIAFIAVHQGLWGVYMGCSFAPGHKGMPTYTEATTMDFLEVGSKGRNSDTGAERETANSRRGPWE